MENGIALRRHYSDLLADNTIKSMLDAGIPLPQVLSNPAWEALIERIDTKLEMRKRILAQVVRNMAKYRQQAGLPLGPIYTESMSADDAHRDTDDLEARRRELLAMVDASTGLSAMKQGAQQPIGNYI